MGLLICVSSIISPTDLQTMQRGEGMEPMYPEQGVESRALSWEPLVPCVAWKHPRLLRCMGSSLVKWEDGSSEFGRSDFQWSFILCNVSRIFFFLTKRVKWSDLGNTHFKRAGILWAFGMLDIINLSEMWKSIHLFVWSALAPGICQALFWCWELTSEQKASVPLWKYLLSNEGIQRQSTMIDLMTNGAKSCTKK